MMSSMPPLSCLLLLAAVVPTAAGGLDEAGRSQISLVEQASQEGFPLQRSIPGWGGRPLKAVGVHLRVRDGAKLYALCLYVDTAALAARTKGGPRSAEALAAMIVEGGVAHAFVSRFVQGVPRENRMAFLLGNLQEAWSGPGFDPGSPAMRRFSAFFDRPVAQGAETQVWIQPGGLLQTREAGGRPTATRAPAIATAFSASYLGARPMDPALKADLLRELPAVLELEEMLGAKVAPARRAGPAVPRR